MHPLEQDLSGLKDSEIENKLLELQKNILLLLDLVTKIS